jgi:organic radical activating enzyme
MQEENLKLKEIIWEICGQCKNGCPTCGSKDVWGAPIDETKKKKITVIIALYPPESIVISGGDPLLVSKDTHVYITDVLKKKNVTCKIIINPKSFINLERVDKTILSLYEVVGVSINSIEDITLFNNRFHRGEVDLKKKITVITNFNLSNIFSFDDIKNFVKDNDLSWQIQYTVFKEEKNPLAIYNNKGSVEYLTKHIKQAIDEKLKVITADNMNCGPCWAGKHTLGITYDGDVVPCLSMRSWVEDIKSVSQGNLLTCLAEDRDQIERLMFEASPLQFIWENEFKSYRFKKFKCCKDVTKELIADYKPLSNFVKVQTIPATSPYITVYYGVQNVPPIVTAYSVPTEVIAVYSVWNAPATVTYTDTVNINTTTAEDKKK